MSSSDEAWAGLRALCERAVAESPETCLGAVADAYMAKRAKIRLVDLWIQALSESDDAVIAKALRRQVREVHAYFAELIEDGQARGVVHADRDPEAEAWLFIAGGLLSTMDHRLPALDVGDRHTVEPDRAPSRAAAAGQTKGPRLRHPGALLRSGGAPLGRHREVLALRPQPSPRITPAALTLHVDLGVWPLCKVPQL